MTAPLSPAEAGGAGAAASPAAPVSTADRHQQPASPWRLAWHRLRRQKAALTGLGIITFFILAALLAPVLTAISGKGPADTDKKAINSYLGGLPKGSFGGMSPEHWLGVEPMLGRDIFARLLYGAQISLLVAFASAIMITLIGVTLGILAGYFGGRIDTVISRFMDVMMSFPSLIFMIALLSVARSVNRVLLLIIVMGVFSWPYVARVIRAQTLSLKHREYVEAARASGTRSSRILLTEILPNLSGTIIVYITLAIPGLIGTEAALTFLGVGVRPPTPSWGQMIADSVLYYKVDPMFFILPSACLFLVVLGFTLLGDALRDALDPKGGKS
ncbi:MULTISPECIES: ABC transporter permease [unclassified Kitasatospora]|uniref:ABC transporter permease n=1 Tax=unclassified Kitasatospora TaxID=2633591 RepID=UPI000709A455|nr:MULTISPECIES: ABC transporter permease [unclassified Kitasatospora]KQV22909.1 peptide ABC transporter permease [Kitasatospora sp. Root107]KRB61768.1 peptide ABC transporter permease [Kitasatospora sp. Root187]